MKASAPAPVFADDGPGATFSLQVSFTGLGAFDIGPAAGWWNDAVVKVYGSQFDSAHKALFFGSNGVLARRIFRVVVGFQPTLKMHFDDRAAFDTACDAFRNSAGAVRIGPLETPIQGAAAVSPAAIRYSASDQTITVGPIKSILPVLLGVVSVDVFR